VEPEFPLTNKYKFFTKSIHFLLKIIGKKFTMIKKMREISQKKPLFRNGNSFIHMNNRCLFARPKNRRNELNKMIKRRYDILDIGG